MDGLLACSLLDAWVLGGSVFLRQKPGKFEC